MLQGFTLAEVILVLLITSILTGIAINFSVFSEENTYLKNFNYRLFSDFSLARNLSLYNQLISGNLFACGYGFLFSSSSYLGYAFVSSTQWLSCDYLASSFPETYAVSDPDYYFHTNGEVRHKQEVIPSLKVESSFKGEIKISTTSQDCSSNNVFSSYSRVAIVYYSPYGDYLFLGQNSSGGWVNLDIYDIYFCLEYRNEKRYLRLNKIGQLMVNIP